MAGIKYHHVVEYDEHTKKITITRVFDRTSDFRPGQPDLYTELSLPDINPSERTFERISAWLGEALVFDTRGLRDEFDSQETGDTTMKRDPIARRNFTFGVDGRRRVEVLVYNPVKDRADFRCDYEIEEDGVVTRAFHAFGVDSMQALILALRQLGAEIMTSEQGMKQELYFNDQNSDLGLLLPEGFSG